MTLPIDPTNELVTLRQTLAELTAKNTSRKARITELEQQLATAQTVAQTAQATLHDIEVMRPMQTLAEAISPTPELFLAELSRVGYKVVKIDGKLVLMQDDQLVEGIELTVDAMKKLLLSTDPRHKNFPHLVIASKASGGGCKGSESRDYVHAEQKQELPKPNKLALGLR